MGTLFQFSSLQQRFRMWLTTRHSSQLRPQGYQISTQRRLDIIKFIAGYFLSDFIQCDVQLFILNSKKILIFGADNYSVQIWQFLLVRPVNLVYICADPRNCPPPQPNYGKLKNHCTVLYSKHLTKLSVSLQ
jgi:hypothetical protein